MKWSTVVKPGSKGSVSVPLACAPGKVLTICKADLRPRYAKFLGDIHCILESLMEASGIDQYGINSLRFAFDGFFGCGVFDTLFEGIDFSPAAMNENHILCKILHEIMSAIIVPESKRKKS